MRRFPLLLLLCGGVVLAPLPAQQKKQQPKKDTEQAPLIPVPKEVLSPQALEAPKPIDPRVRPQIGELREYEFPRYEEATLKNGLKIYIIEDHRQPTIGFRLQVRAGDAYDGSKPGTASLMADLLTKGTRKRTALDIASALDSIGASVNASTGGELLTVTGSGLKKHMALLLAIFSDIIINPTFPKEELDKLMPQVIANIKQRKSRPSELAMALSRMVLYGPNHPSAQRPTEESVKAITPEDIRTFHKTYVRPNNQASLAIVGDVTLKEIIPQIESAFRRWESAAVTVPELPKPQPMPRGVYFVERPGSVQSTILLCGLAPGRKDPDYEKLNLAIELLGNGFSGRLFKTLRETYSFTYTPYAFLTQGKSFNRFVAGADVRTAVTDSAIMVLRREVEKVANDPASEEEFSVIKQNVLGSYQMNFEQPWFVASILQGANYLELSEEYFKGYPKRIAAYSPYDALAAAERYLQPRNWWLVVVGKPDIAKELERWGELYRYDLDLKPIGSSGPEPVPSMSVDELLRRYVNALGGEEKLRSITTIVKTSQIELSAGGQSFAGSALIKQKAPNKLYQQLSLPVVQQEQWIDGTHAWMKQGMQPVQTMPDDLARAAIDRATMFYVAKLPALGYRCTLEGKRNGLIILRAEKGGKENRYYFDETSFLLRRADHHQGPEDGGMTLSEYYDDYAPLDGILLPRSERLESPMFSITSRNSYQLNVPLEDAEFEPKH